LRCWGPCPVPRSFPTRRSSGLGSIVCGLFRSRNRLPGGTLPEGPARQAGPTRMWSFREGLHVLTETLRDQLRTPPVVGVRVRRRSEEHTSELQSRFDLVCRLLL